MLNYLPYESDEMLENDESYEYDESDESDEARRRRRPPVRIAKRGGAVPPRPAPGFATRTELTATANRLDAKIVTNSAAIKAVEGRTNTLLTDVGKLKTEVGKLQGGINDVRNMSMLMPLLTSQTTRAVTAPVNGTAIATGDKVVVDNGDSFSKLLPLLMFSGGMGGSSSSSSGSGGGMFGGDSGGIMMVAMMMAMQNK